MKMKVQRFFMRSVPEILMPCMVLILKRERLN